MYLITKDIIKQLKIEKVKIPKIRCNSNKGGLLKAYKSRGISKMSKEEVNIFTYIDDGAMLFNSKDDVIKESRIVCKIIAKWYLTVHIGYGGKK